VIATAKDVIVARILAIFLMIILICYDILAYDESEINWQLNNDATAKKFESWERHMLHGFYRCATYDHHMDNSTCLALAI
jgi:hypothetical protein